MHTVKKIIYNNYYSVATEGNQQEISHTLKGYDICISTLEANHPSVQEDISRTVR